MEEKKQKKKIIYRETIRNARKLYKETGISLIVLLVLFGLFTDYVLIPILGKLWGLALTTTPNGFISNANLVSSLIKSPWIILIGVAIAFVYALFALWQVSILYTGICYAYQGKRIKLWDLFRVSFSMLCGRKRSGTILVLIYALILVPATNIHQASNLISSFIIPEYIQDFINSKTILFVLFIMLVLFLIYLVLRWMFLLPSFILKRNNFTNARKESLSLTKNSLFRNFLNLEIHTIIETLRLSLLPMLLILLPVFISFLATRKLNYSLNLFNAIGITWGMELIKIVTGVLVQISVLCFTLVLYFDKLKENGMDIATDLPEVKSAPKEKINIYGLQAICGAVFAVVICGVYLVTVNISQNDSSVILELFGKTEVIAHKGYSSKAPENTMPAFDLADKSKNVSFIEIDVWSTKDGVPVVLHNASIKDATGVDKDIYDCTYDEIKDLPAPYAMPSEDFPAAKIPTLEEVLKTYAASTPILIEIKGFKEDPELPAKIVEQLKKYDEDNKCQVQSGDYEALKAVKKLNPKIACGLILAMVTGNYYDLLYVDFFSIEHTFVNQNTVSLLERRGKKVYAWTVNYPESAKSLEFSGVHGLITDYPDVISEYVADGNKLVRDVMINAVNRVFGDTLSDDAIDAFLDEEY